MLLSRGEGAVGRLLAVLLLLGMAAGGVYAWWMLAPDHWPWTRVVATEHGEPASGSGRWLKDVPRGDELGVALPVQAHSSAVADEDRPLVVTLDDGARLEIPAGTLARGQVVHLRRRELAEAETSAGFAIWDVDLGGEELARAATLRLPLEGPEARSELEGVTVRRLDVERGRWVPIEASLSADGRAVEIQSTRFSPVARSQPSDLAAYAKKAQQAGRSKGPLLVPYHSQDRYGWCWAASLASLEDFAGGRRTVWGIAADFAVGDDVGWLGAEALAKYAKKRKLAVSLQRWWWSVDDLRGYLMFQLDNDRPVWFASVHAEHVVTVVGYTPTHVIIQDSSGIMVDAVVGTPGAAAANDHQLVNYPIPWATWDNVFESDAIDLAVDGASTTWGQWNPFRDLFANYSLVLPKAGVAPRPLSLQLRPGNQTFKTLHPGPHKAREVLFDWDGKAADGWTFEHVIPGGGAPTKASAPHALCNSDRIAPLVPYLSNSGPSELTVKLAVAVDGVELASADVKVPPGSNWPVPFPVPELDFGRNPLAPGPHKLTVKATSGAWSDETTITFDMHPALVPGVSATRPDPKHVKLAWSPNPEEAAHGRKIAYEIRRGQRPSRNLHSVVKRVAPGVHEVELELSKADMEKDWVYSVWAIDERTRLGSVDATPIRATEDVNYFPLKVGTELAYQTTFRMPKMPPGLRFTMTEVMTVPREGLVKATVKQTIKSKEVDATMDTVIDRSFDRVGSALHFGDADVVLKMRAVAKRKGKRQETSIRLRTKLTQSRPAVMLTRESELRASKGWNNDTAGKVRIVDVSGNAPGVGKIDMKTLTQNMPGFDASSQGLGGFASDGKVEVAGFEKVTVPGGTFDDCVKLVVRSSSKGVKATVTVWLAPNIGPVKQVQVVRGPKELGSITMTKVLSSKPKLPK